MKHLFKSIILLIVFTSLTSGQSLKFGVGGGLSIVSSPEFYTKNISLGGLGFSSEYHFNLKAKFSIPVLPITFVGEVNYNLLNGEESFVVPTYFNGYTYNVDVNAETQASILTIGAGAQYSLIPGPISPYVSASLLYNSFSELTITATGTYQGVSETDETKVGETVSRMGAGIGAGVNISILPLFDIDVSARYNLMNLTGKEENEEAMNMAQINLTLFFGF